MHGLGTTDMYGSMMSAAGQVREEGAGRGGKEVCRRHDGQPEPCTHLSGEAVAHKDKEAESEHAHEQRGGRPEVHTPGRAHSLGQGAHATSTCSAPSKTPLL